jgi:radical SAM superfamily enzyme YgiQ (UPF0313 family)
MGGFHATLCPDEVAQFAEIVVVGEAEDVWARLIDDVRHGRPETDLSRPGATVAARLRPDRRIFRGKRYLPIGLVEAGRGCHFKCEFCAIQSYFHSTQSRRPVDAILDEIRASRSRTNFFFFVDDNITSNLAQAKEWLRALAPLNVRWVSQSSINAAHDEEFLDLLVAAGCRGVLIGFESLDPAALAAMNKSFNTMRGGYGPRSQICAAGGCAMRDVRLRLRHRHAGSFTRAVDFAKEHAFYIAAFNHLTPFPGTPLCTRLKTRAACSPTPGGWRIAIATTPCPSSRRR